MAGAITAHWGDGDVPAVWWGFVRKPILSTVLRQVPFPLSECSGEWMAGKSYCTCHWVSVSYACLTITLAYPLCYTFCQVYSYAGIVNLSYHFLSSLLGVRSDGKFVIIIFYEKQIVFFFVTPQHLNRIFSSRPCWFICNQKLSQLNLELSFTFCQISHSI